MRRCCFGSYSLPMAYLAAGSTGVVTARNGSILMTIGAVGKEWSDPKKWLIDSFVMASIAPATELFCSLHLYLTLVRIALPFES